MRAVGRWSIASSPPGILFSADCSSESQPSVASFSVLMTGPRGQRLGAVATSICSSPPPQSCSNSTMSLLSPLGHQSFSFDDEHGDGEDEEDVDEDTHDVEAEVLSLRGTELPGRASSKVESEDNQEEQKQVHIGESSLTPWEVWFVGKEKEERDRLQQKALEVQLDSIFFYLILSSQSRVAVEWVQKKNEQKRKEREQKMNKEMEEKAAKELEKEHLQEKAKEKYQEWLKKKIAEECEKKKKEKVFLLNLVVLFCSDFSMIVGFYSGTSYPEPAFCNPIPWKPIHMPPPKEAKDLSGKKNKRPVISQPHRSSLVIHKARSNLCLGTLCKMER
uniref:Coiled-coil domain containing 34 n=1 Tax=Ictidomys tridecemlineatus TaxID=43179 RepID=A0A287DA79_ICTTR